MLPKDIQKPKSCDLYLARARAAIQIQLSSTSLARSLARLSLAPHSSPWVLERASRVPPAPGARHRQANYPMAGGEGQATRRDATQRALTSCVSCSILISSIQLAEFGYWEAAGGRKSLKYIDLEKAYSHIGGENKLLSDPEMEKCTWAKPQRSVRASITQSATMYKVYYLPYSVLMTASVMAIFCLPLSVSVTASDRPTDRPTERRDGCFPPPSFLPTKTLLHCQGQTDGRTDG